jgi:hypothetical protein
MIAPARQQTDTQTAGREAKLRQARRLVAESLLNEESETAPSAPAIAPWRAWLVCGWLVLVAGCYVVALLSGRM